VHERPGDLTDGEVAAALREYWRLDLAGLSYLPVGFGGYHWRAHDMAGRDWFVTANRLTSPDQLADLAASMATAASLAAAGLDFVVAPVCAPAGELVCPVGSGYAMTVYPFAAGAPGRWGDQLAAADRAVVIDTLAALHGQPADAVPAPVRPPDLPGRPVLVNSLRERGEPWLGGPYAEEARTVVSGHAVALAAALATFDDLAAQVSTAASPPVITHGEAHPGNLIRRGDGFALIDWDTVGLAQPDRDLWWVLSGPGPDADRYARRTGREVSQAGLALYRLRWDLDDICQFLAEFRAPHRRDADTEVAFAGFVEEVRRLAAR
jgi:spectinomycin phosphotransferase